MDDIARLGYAPDVVCRQQNSGLLFARLAGLRLIHGRYVIFLDSDDLISPDKLRSQVAAMDREHADVSYTDSARCVLDGDYDSLRIDNDTPSAATQDPAEFYIQVQPAPHSPVFRSEYLQRIVAEPLFPPAANYNCVAEIWFYHNAATRPAKVIKVPGPRSIIGVHSTGRLTGCWERLAAASLAVMEAFARGCPAGSAEAPARQRVAEKAFVSWRRLPRGFSRDFDRRLLSVWRGLNRSRDPRPLGGSLFQAVSRAAGPVAAGGFFRLLQNGPYSKCRTLDDAAFARIMQQLPPP